MKIENLERKTHEIVGRIRLHLFDLLKNTLHRRVLQVVLVLRHSIWFTPIHHSRLIQLNIRDAYTCMYIYIDRYIDIFIFQRVTQTLWIWFEYKWKNRSGFNSENRCTFLWLKNKDPSEDVGSRADTSSEARLLVCRSFIGWGGCVRNFELIESFSGSGKKNMYKIIILEYYKVYRPNYHQSFKIESVAI